jgi:hypothetical protein
VTVSVLGELRIFAGLDAWNPNSLSLVRLNRLVLRVSRALLKDVVINTKHPLFALHCGDHEVAILVAPELVSVTFDAVVRSHKL